MINRILAWQQWANLSFSIFRSLIIIILFNGISIFRAIKIKLHQYDKQQLIGLCVTDVCVTIDKIQILYS